MIKNIFKSIMLVVPIVIVFAVLLNAINIDMKGTTYKFKIEQYDPYDILRGRFLNVAIESKNYMIDDFIGLKDSGSKDEFYKLVLRICNEKNKNKKNSMINNVEKIMKYSQKYEEYTDIKDMNELEEFFSAYKALGEFTKVDNGVVVNYNMSNDNSIYEELQKLAKTESTFKHFCEVYEKQYKRISKLTEEQKDDLYDELRNKEYYIKITIDDNGYANFGQITSNTSDIDDSVNYLKAKIYDITYGSIIPLFSISLPGINFYTDERYAYDYQQAINYAMREKLETYAVVKLLGTNMIVKDIMVGDMNLKKYYETVYKPYQESKLVECTVDFKDIEEYEDYEESEILDDYEDDEEEYGEEISIDIPEEEEN